MADDDKDKGDDDPTKGLPLKTETRHDTAIEKGDRPGEDREERRGDKRSE